MQIYRYKEIKDINQDCLMLLKLFLRYSLEKEFNLKNHNLNILYQKIKTKIKYIPEQKILDGIIRHRIITTLNKEKEILNLMPNLEKDLEILSKNGSHENSKHYKRNSSFIC